MSSLWSQLRGFVQAFRAGAGARPRRHRGHAIARTIKDATTLTGANANTNFGSVGTERRQQMMVEAAERYDASFDERRQAPSAPPAE